jgi:hypothetical protein
MPSTEIIGKYGEECSGKMKKVHDGGMGERGLRPSP